ncbi:DUF4139 domain-containing protein [Geothrix sp. 21YS21S-4]|uniref:DUF4139 domain-containing protein n=1 Tax=Geothrix sp. 21YS21S-4 TaxID=3068889 RepID=UPI0027B9D364|nr:DUF4139 domain-containing protein [Geothrix sp. 21YS21S-4]
MRVALLAALPALLSAQETATTLKDQKALAVTIYNDNRALVKDTRDVRLTKGETRLAFQDVAAQIRPETALLRNLTAPKDFWVAEQNFDFDLLTPQKLLEKYVGEKVVVVRSVQNADGAGAKEVREEATVLATNSGTVLQFADRIETTVPGRIVFPGVPGNLRARPTLVITLHSGIEREQKLELSYLTGGLSWRADYVANLATDEKTLDLSGWVTLTNQGSVPFPNATLQLVAGDLNRARTPMPGSAPGGIVGSLMKAEAAPRMAEESLFEYHLYTLDRPTTLAANQTKQVALLSAASVPARKEFLLQGQDYYYSGSYGLVEDKRKVGVFVEFDNKEASRLGMPLPKGVIRVYKRDGDGRAQFVGEDNVDHTPQNERVRLKLGEAFDVTARRKQTDYKSLGKQGKFGSVHESAFEVELKNAKKEPVTVTVLEPLPGDWEVIQSSHPCTKSAAHEGRFQVTVPAEGRALLTYRVRVKW